MSYVTDAILTWSVLENEDTILERINAKMPDGKHFLKIESVGGDNHAQAEMAVGAFNYFDSSQIVYAMQSVDWRYPEEVQVYAKDENQNLFNVHRIIDPGGIKQLSFGYGRVGLKRL